MLRLHGELCRLECWRSAVQCAIFGSCKAQHNNGSCEAQHSNCVNFGDGPCTAPRLMTCFIVADIGLAGNAAVFVHFCCFSVHIFESCFIAESAGDQMFGCNAVQDTLLLAAVLSNKGISVSCNKVRVVVARPKAESRVSLHSSEIMLLQPLDRMCNPPQHRLRNSAGGAWSKACQTSVNYAMIYSRSGIPTTILCLAASRSSHTAT